VNYSTKVLIFQGWVSIISSLLKNCFGPLTRHFKKIPSLETLLNIERGVIFLKRVQFFLIFVTAFYQEKAV
jgi:hypothetical protein